MGEACRQLKRKLVGLGGVSASVGDRKSMGGACRQLKRSGLGWEVLALVLKMENLWVELVDS